MKSSGYLVFFLLLILGGCSTYNIDLNTTPKTSGVQIFVNGNHYGDTGENGGLALNEIKLGQFGILKIEAKYQDFQALTEINQYTIIKKENILSMKSPDPGSTSPFNYEINIGKIPKSVANLRLVTNVPNVDIYINNSIIGRVATNMYMDHSLRPGTYRLKASKIDYEDLEMTLFLEDGAEKEISLTMTEIQHKYGYLRLTSNEKFVDVYVNGRLEGQIPGGETPFNKRVKTGQAEIMVKKQFFSPNSIRVDVKENDIISYHFDLVKATGGSELTPTQSSIYQTRGNLLIVTERNDLVVYIDGSRRIPPIRLDNIPAGFYSIQVKGPDIDDSFTVTVEDKRTAIVDLDLRY